MISKVLLSGSMAVLLVATIPSAFAATIASDYTMITTTGQSYNYTIDLTGSDYTNMTSVTLEVTAKGDYGSTATTGGTTPREWFTFNLDDTTFADMWGNTTGLAVDYSGFTSLSGPTITSTPPATDDFVMTATFSISDMLFQSLASDGNILVNWQNGPEVDPYHDLDKDGGVDYVQWNISAVPVPAAAWLFMSALLSFVGLSRKAQSAA